MSDMGTGLRRCDRILIRPCSALAERSLERVPELADLPALPRVGESAGAGGEVVLDVAGIAGRRDRTGYGGFGENIFEKQFRPGCTIEFLRPVGECVPANAAEQIASLQWLVGNHRNAALGSHRQQLGFCSARGQRVAELDE